MKYAGAESHNQEEQHANSWIKGSADGCIQPCLASSAKGSQNEPSHVEFCRFTPSEKRADLRNDCVESHIEPTSDGVFGGILPRL